MEFDRLDAAIVRALLVDARLSLRAVARAVDSTPTTVGERLRRLEAAGLVQGASLRLAPDLLPGRLRLVRGRLPADRRAAVLAVATRTPGVLEALAAPGRLLAVIAVRDLDEEEQVVGALEEAGASDLTVGAVARAEGPPPTHLFAAATVVAEPCAVCGRETTDPLTKAVDGRRVPFCCASCQEKYLKRYGELQARAAQHA